MFLDSQEIPLLNASGDGQYSSGLSEVWSGFRVAVYYP